MSTSFLPGRRPFVLLGAVVCVSVVEVYNATPNAFISCARWIVRPFPSAAQAIAEQRAAGQRRDQGEGAFSDQCPNARRSP